MIVGVNTDVRYRGKTFHIQTEDSGPNNPVLVTHVFVGGSIIVTRRSEYTDLLNTPDWEDAVRQRMRGQHREVAEALQQGDFKDEIKRAGRGVVRPDIPLARDTKAAKKKRPSKPVESSLPPAVEADGLPPPVAPDGLPPPNVDEAPPAFELPPPTMSAPPPDLAADGPPPASEGTEYQTPMTEGEILDGERLAWYLDDT